VPPEVIDACYTPAATILDWGCARGQLVGIFRKRFPLATVDGIDHSREGIEQGRENFPDGLHGHLYHEAGGTIWHEYDVIVNSNVMEHLVDPIGVLRAHLQRCRQFYVILTPYEEPLGDARREAMTPEERHAEGHTHVQKFHLGSFPVQIEGFARAAQIHDVEPGDIWPGYQLLVVYKRI